MACIRDLAASACGFKDAEATPLTYAKILQELRPRLSKKASLYFPTSPSYKNYTELWSESAVGDILVVVVPAIDSDVAETVKYSNFAGLPFLAINRGHGTADQLGTIKHGVLINLRSLDSIQIAQDGKTAVMGGGVAIDQVIETLAQKGKTSASGSCGCVGMLGPGLGGGLGKYMGYYGLVSDNIIHMSVVTANGSAITVSASENADLYWGMRGAGHNFGVVTKFRYKIYDYPNPNSYYVTYTYTGDKVEAVFEQLNRLGNNGKQPKEINSYLLYSFNASLSSKLYYTGTSSAARHYVEPFLAIRPLVVENATVPYAELATALGVGVGGVICAPGLSHRLFPVGLLEYDVHANRKLYSLYEKLLAEEPLFNKSTVQFEGYALHGMQAVDPASSAYAHRMDNLLVSFSTAFTKSAPLEDTARRYGLQARNILHEGDRPGRPLNAYVNYAYGDETLEQLYGYEPWRLQRLRVLKKKWDPNGRFNFYNPIQ
ncbi:MAG: hypothetical protein LQ351_005674 [Letrouitia transgressa]|nr:MAG: hypothetical protein LQ351_005674 [Letrouitia transgressa]